jgi:hypothetical protein
VTAVRCASCHRTIAVAAGEQPLRNKVYCSEWCLHEPAAAPNEARNDMWRAMVEHGISPVKIGKVYNVPHSQVYKSVARG